MKDERDHGSSFEEDGEHGGESFDILRKGKEAMKREICEETGIYVDIKNIETLGGIVMPTRKNMNGLWQIGKVDISDLRKCNFRKNSSEDLVDHKVIVFPYIKLDKGDISDIRYQPLQPIDEKEKSICQVMFILTSELIGYLEKYGEKIKKK